VDGAVGGLPRRPTPAPNKSDNLVPKVRYFSTSKFEQTSYSLCLLQLRVLQKRPRAPEIPGQVLLSAASKACQQPVRHVSMSAASKASGS
jgi:hypothetical protein